MKKLSVLFLSVFVTAVWDVQVRTQTFASDDSVIRQIWTEGIENSQTYSLGQVLFDKLGPRLTGTPGKKHANDWLVDTYTKWGIDADNDRLGAKLPAHLLNEVRPVDRGGAHYDPADAKGHCLPEGLEKSNNSLRNGYLGS